MKANRITIALALAAQVAPCPASESPVVEAWASSYHRWGTGDNVPLAVAVAGNGDVVATGNAFDEFDNSSWLTVAVSGRTGEVIWTQSYDGPGEFHAESPAALAADAEGNVYVTGVVGYGRAGFPDDDYLTIKYSNVGMPVWARRFDGPGLEGTGSGVDIPCSLALDPDGNIIVTGRSQGLRRSDGTDGIDCVTIKYSPEGEPLWTTRHNGPANRDYFPKDLAVDSGGNIFVTGWTDRLGTDADYLTLAVSRDGEPLWAMHYNGPGNSTDYANAVAVDRDGNVFVTGFSASVQVGGTSVSEYATVAYSPAGEVRWEHRYNANGIHHGYQNLANDVAVDHAGNVFVTGGAGGFQSPSGGFATLKYSNSGAPLWTRTYNGPVTQFGHNDDARAVAVDLKGNVIVTGRSDAEGSDSNDADLATVAYSNDGTPLWTHRYNGPANGDDVSLTHQSLALGPDGSVYVTGASDGDPSEAQKYEFVIVKYAPPPGPPTLEVAKVDGQVVLSWSAELQDVYPEASTDLGHHDPWWQVGWDIVLEGNRYSMTVPVQAPQLFFRLRALR